MAERRVRSDDGFRERWKGELSWSQKEAAESTLGFCTEQRAEHVTLS